ncbi:MAG: hypothetical protein KGS72_18325 [Cyanobacteria bacterium REEB67]|nr:hypothetical protein [Cyanobacteria bacterium REEB67]
MTSKKILVSISLLVMGTTIIPLTAESRNNYNGNEQLIMNNFNTAEGNISSQINSYVNSGQLSPQAAASYNAELSQIASQGMLQPGNSMAVQQTLNQFNSLTSQIQSSLSPAGTYTGGAANPYVYGAATRYNGSNPYFYNNWRNRLGLGNYTNYAGGPGYVPGVNNQVNAYERQQNANAVLQHAEAVNAIKRIDHQVKSNDIVRHDELMQQEKGAVGAVREQEAMDRLHNIEAKQAVERAHGGAAGAHHDDHHDGH